MKSATSVSRDCVSSAEKDAPLVDESREESSEEGEYVDDVGLAAARRHGVEIGKLSLSPPSSPPSRQLRKFGSDCVCNGSDCGCNGNCNINGQVGKRRLLSSSRTT